MWQLATFITKRTPEPRPAHTNQAMNGSDDVAASHIHHQVLNPKSELRPARFFTDTAIRQKQGPDSTSKPTW